MLHIRFRTQHFVRYKPPFHLSLPSPISWKMPLNNQESCITNRLSLSNIKIGPEQNLLYGSCSAFVNIIHLSFTRKKQKKKKNQNFYRGGSHTIHSVIRLLSNVTSTHVDSARGCDMSQMSSTSSKLRTWKQSNGCLDQTVVIRTNAKCRPLWPHGCMTHMELVPARMRVLSS
jgi:hypothetical protein